MTLLQSLSSPLRALATAFPPPHILIHLITAANESASPLPFRLICNHPHPPWLPSIHPFCTLSLSYKVDRREELHSGLVIKIHRQTNKQIWIFDCSPLEQSKGLKRCCITKGYMQRQLNHVKIYFFLKYN